MAESTTTGSPTEQRVCVQCGFCCDGTLFTHAHLLAGEYPDLPALLKGRYRSEGKDESFDLPCPYFAGKCTIYDQHKPAICSTFQCKVLKKMSAGELKSTEAVAAIARFKEWRQEIFELYKSVFGKKYAHSFYDLLRELPRLNNKNEEAARKVRIDLLIMKCGLLDATLTKYFKPDAAFQDLLEMEASDQ